MLATKERPLSADQILRQSTVPGRPCHDMPGGAISRASCHRFRAAAVMKAIRQALQDGGGERNDEI